MQKSINGLSPGSTYIIQVASVGAEGQSEWSPTLQITIPKPVLVPNPPTNVTATGNPDNIKISWTQATQNTDGGTLAQPAYYEVYQGFDSSLVTTGSAVAKTSGSSFTYPTTFYDKDQFFKVVTVDGFDNKSAASTAVSAKTIAPSVMSGLITKISSYNRGSTGGTVAFTTVGPHGVTGGDKVYVYGSYGGTGSEGVDTRFGSPATVLSSPIPTETTFSVYNSLTGNIVSVSSTTGSITSVTGNGSTVTYTSTYTPPAGQQVTISGVIPNQYNLKNAVVTSSTTGATFSIAAAATGAYVSGGEVVNSLPAYMYPSDDAVRIKNDGITVGNMSTGFIVGIAPTSFNMQSSDDNTRLSLTSNELAIFKNGDKLVDLNSGGTFKIQSSASGNRLQIDPDNGIVIYLYPTSGPTGPSDPYYKSMQLSPSGLSGYDISVTNGTGNDPTYKNFSLSSSGLELANASIRTGQKRKLGVSNRQFDFLDADTLSGKITFTTDKNHGLEVGDYVRVSSLWDEELFVYDTTVVSGIIYTNLESTPNIIDYPKASQVWIDSNIPQHNGVWGMYDHGNHRLPFNTTKRVNTSLSTTGTISQQFLNRKNLASFTAAPTDKQRNFTTTDSMFEYEVGDAVRIRAVPTSGSSPGPISTTIGATAYTPATNPSTMFVQSSTAFPTSGTVIVDSKISNIASWSRTGGTAMVEFTVSTTANTPLVGDYVYISGTNPATGNADTTTPVIVTESSPDEAIFKCQPNTDTTAISGGTAGTGNTQGIRSRLEVDYTGKGSGTLTGVTLKGNGRRGISKSKGGTAYSANTVKLLSSDFCLLNAVTSTTGSASSATAVSAFTGSYDSDYLSSSYVNGIFTDFSTNGSHGILDQQKFSLSATYANRSGTGQLGSLVSTGGHSVTGGTTTTSYNQYSDPDSITDGVPTYSFTYSTPGYYLFAGQNITISGSTNTKYNVKNAKVLSSTTLGFTCEGGTASPGAYTGGSTVATLSPGNVDTRSLYSLNNADIRYKSKETLSISGPGTFNANYWTFDSSATNHPFRYGKDDIGLYQEAEDGSVAYSVNVDVDDTGIVSSTPSTASVTLTNRNASLDARATKLNLDWTQPAGEKFYASFPYGIRIDNTAADTGTYVSSRIRSGGAISPPLSATNVEYKDYKKMMLLSNTDSLATISTSDYPSECYSSVSNGVYVVIEATDKNIVVFNALLKDKNVISSTAFLSATGNINTTSEPTIEKVSPGAVIEDVNGNPYVALPSGSTEKYESPGLVAAVKSTGRRRIGIQSATLSSGVVTITTTSEHGLEPENYVEVVNAGGIITNTYNPSKVLSTPSNNTFTYVPTYTGGIAVPSPIPFEAYVEKVLAVKSAVTELQYPWVSRQVLTYLNYNGSASTTGTAEYADYYALPKLRVETSGPHGLKNGDSVGVELNNSSNTGDPYIYYYPNLEVLNEKEFQITTDGIARRALGLVGASPRRFSSITNATRASTVAVNSNEAVLPQEEIYASSVGATWAVGTGAVAGFPNSGTIFVTTSEGIQRVTYTGINRALNKFTGCSGGEGEMTFGNAITMYTLKFNTSLALNGTTISWHDDPDNPENGSNSRNLKADDEVVVNTSASDWNNEYSRILYISTNSFIEVMMDYPKGPGQVPTDTASLGSVSFYKRFGSDGGSLTGKVYLLQGQRPQIQLTSPSTNYERSSSSVVVEPGTSKLYPSAIKKQTGSNSSLSPSSLGGGNTVSINTINTSSGPSNSRIILNAGEVIFTANERASLSFDTNTWAARDGYGISLVQEMDGWWSLNGILYPISSLGANAGAVFNIAFIDSDFARPDYKTLSPGIMAVNGEPHVIAIEIWPNGRITGWMPAFIPTGAATNTATTAITWGGDALNDWVSVSGIRWKGSSHV